MNRPIRATLVAFAFAVGAGLATGASAQIAGVPAKKHSCQRGCLQGYVDKYLAAMRDKKVDPGLFARDVRFTENGVRMPLGNEGLWFDTSSIGHYKFYIPDVQTQQIAFFGTVKTAECAVSRRSSGMASSTVSLICLRLLRRRPGSVEGTERPIRGVFVAQRSTRAAVCWHAPEPGGRPRSSPGLAAG